jgi:hypothetical protein
MAMSSLCEPVMELKIGTPAISVELMSALRGE